MSFDDLQSGVVIDHPFLWVRGSRSGETEGRKSRPSAVGLRLARPDGPDAILLFPITTKDPGPDRLSAEIPDIEKKRGGLDIGLRLWIILDELNEDLVGESFYLSPDATRGRFSKAFFSPLMRKFIAYRASTRATSRR